MRKLIIGVVVAAAVAGAAYLYLKKENGAPTYRTAKVERGDIVDTITATGNINAVTTVSVGSQISGTIQKLFVDYNSRVRKDQVIAQIDPQLLEASVTQARGNFENAKASLEKAKVTITDTERTYRRNRELLANGFVAQSDVDAAQTAHDQAVAGQKSAEAVVTQSAGALKIARTNLEYATIRSPVDGIVISRSVDVGQTVAASFQTPTLFSIAQDLTKMQIDTNVDEADIGRAVKGQTVVFTVDAWPAKTFTGVVSQVRNAPIITQNVVTYDVVILVDNRELLLKPGMTTNVTIEVKRFGNVLKIPNAAMRYRPSDTSKDAVGGGAGKKKEAMGQRVYVIGKNGKPQAVPVKTRVSDGAYTELVEGNLKEGDLLVTGEAPKGTSSSGGSPPGMGLGRIR
ncbi:MAG: efflux RND transporter periplasmic adaptor subunit [Deltaproteobacteria bacterium]|nr:efflux RND transporter periplasmic adaptor subunit [Deltaproteobacteria bacterium]